MSNLKVPNLIILFQLGVPFAIAEIIDSPMEEFNSMMMQTGLTEEQISLCRDIRRRGKNKVNFYILKQPELKLFNLCDFLGCSTELPSPQA